VGTTVGGQPAYYREVCCPRRVPRVVSAIPAESFQNHDPNARDDVALLIACTNVALLGRHPLGIAYWLMISALLSSNGIWHGWASYKSYSYSPGVVTGVLIYVYGYIEFLRSGSVSIWTAAIACIVGGSYHFWSAIYHGVLKKA
jgi:hypothetical protein